MAADGTTLDYVARRNLANPGPINEARIESICATLRDGSFRIGVTLAGFAAKWGVEIQRVRELSAEANKRVRREVADDHDRIAAKGYAMLETVADRAMKGVDKDGCDAKHLGVAVKAIDIWLTKSGAAAPTKAVVGVTSDLALLSDEQLEARKAEVLARLAGIQGGGGGGS